MLDAPLTVDNFLELARKGFFNGLSVHRVVLISSSKLGIRAVMARAVRATQFATSSTSPFRARRGRDGA